MYQFPYLSPTNTTYQVDNLTWDIIFIFFPRLNYEKI